MARPPAPASLSTYWPDRVTWLVGLGTTLGLASQSATPWIVGALIDSAGLDVQQATLMSTAEMAAMGLVMVGLSPFIHRLPHKALTLSGAALALAAQALSAAAEGVWALAFWRVLSGVGFGVIYSTASAAGAAAASPARAYAAAGVISLLLGTLLNPALGFGSERFGHGGVFAGLSAYALALSLPLLAMPFRTERAKASPPTDAPGAHGPVRALSILAVMGVMGLFAIATNGVFVFVERVGAGVGLRGAELGSGMSVVSLIGAVGGVAAARIGTGRGVAAPLAFGLIAIGAVSFAFLVSGSPWAFWISFSLWVALYWFVYPYIFDLAVRVDPRGRVASATGSALILFGAAGSALAGAVSQRYGMQSFAILAFAGCSAAALAGIAVARLLRPVPPVAKVSYSTNIVS